MSTDSRKVVGELAAAVIAADGQVTHAEMRAVARLETLGLGDLTPFVIGALERAARERQPIDVDAITSALGRLGPETGAIVVSALAEVAASDGAIPTSEMRVLATIGRRLGVAETDIERIAEAAALGRGIRWPTTSAASDAPAATSPATAAQPGGESPESPAGGEAMRRAARLLGVPTDGSREDLDAAYRRVVELYDPLRVVDLGSEFAILAVRRLQAATDAYEFLLAHPRA